MAKAEKTALAKFRQRLKRRGVVRIEVQVRKEDAALVRSVASALVDPERETQARALLRQQFAKPSAVDLKALLAAAPLEGIDLERARDTGRKVEL